MSFFAFSSPSFSVSNQNKRSSDCDDDDVDISSHSKKSRPSYDLSTTQSSSSFYPIHHQPRPSVYYHSNIFPQFVTNAVQYAVQYAAPSRTSPVPPSSGSPASKVMDDGLDDSQIVRHLAQRAMANASPPAAERATVSNADRKFLTWN